MKILGHERAQFLGVGIQIGQQPLNGGSKFGERCVGGIPQHLFAQEFSEPLDQVQIG